MRHSPAVAALAAVLLSPAFAWANGALAFLGTPTTVTSGSANSYMNLYSDCPGACSAPSGVAIPAATSAVTLTTQKTGSALVFTFTIPDQTRFKDGTTTTPLMIGDKIIVQINPNNSGGTTLEMGGGASSDYRFDVTIKNAQVTQALRRIPVSPTGWGGSPPTIANLCPTATLPALTCGDATAAGSLGAVTLSPGPPYVVTLTLPLTLGAIGMTPASGDFGLAIGIINDLGHDSVNSMGITVQDLTAVVFPNATLPASATPYADPGVIPSVPAGGAWTDPTRWGTGYVSAPTAPETQLSLSQLPVPYLSNSIKISVCDASQWDEIGVADTSFDQTMLAKWYLFNRDDPCKMGVWVKVANSGAIANARLLLLWAEGGLGSANWQRITLTDPIAFLPGESTFRIPWDALMPAPGGLHACLRVYILPPAITPAQQLAIDGITTFASVIAFEGAFPTTPMMAQMNFTNYANGVCAAGICNKVAESSWSTFLLASLEALGPRPAYAQSVRQELRASPVAKESRRRPDADFAFAVVSVQGYGVAEGPKRTTYQFVEPLGGIAAAIPVDLVAQKAVPLTFLVTNPPLYAKDPKTRKLREVKTAPRRVMLVAKADAPKDVHVAVKVGEFKAAMKPGEARRVTATVSLDGKEKAR